MDWLYDGAESENTPDRTSKGRRTRRLARGLLKGTYEFWGSDALRKVRAQRISDELLEIREGLQETRFQWVRDELQRMSDELWEMSEEIRDEISNETREMNDRIDKLELDIEGKLR